MAVIKVAYWEISKVFVETGWRNLLVRFLLNYTVMQNLLTDVTGLTDLKLQCGTDILLGEAESVLSKLRTENCLLFVAINLLFYICNCCQLCWPGCTQVNLLSGGSLCHCNLVLNLETM